LTKFFFFFLDFGLSQLTSASLQFIHCHVAGFYKPTIPQSPPSHLQDYSICNNARLEFSTIFVPSFDPIEWCLKNGLHRRGSNSQPFSHKSSALTTRPRLLAQIDQVYIFNFLRNFHYTVKPVYNAQRPPLGPKKKMSVWKRDLINVRFRLVVDESNRPLLTGGRCSEVAVRSGLAVQWAPLYGINRLMGSNLSHLTNPKLQFPT
jgi:hypothetical protein